MKILFLLFISSLFFLKIACVLVENDVLYPCDGLSYRTPQFGGSVAISSDGSRALVGVYFDDTQATDGGAAYVFDVNPSNSSDWVLQTILIPALGQGNPRFGWSVALSSDGSRALVGAWLGEVFSNFIGMVFVFDVSPSNSNDWVPQTVLYPSNGLSRFGWSVALSSDGARALVGAPLYDKVGNNAGAVYVFDVNPSNSNDWMSQTVLYPSNGNGEANFGISVAISSDGSRALVGAHQDDTEGSDVGAAYVFDVNQSNPSDWMFQTILYPSNGTGAPRFGWSVALSSDGSRALVSALGDDTEGTYAGAAYIFDVNPINPSDWMEQTILYPSNGTGQTYFGRSVAISSDGLHALVGADGDDTEGSQAGAMYVFDVNPSNSSDWMLQTVLYPSNGSGEPRFGWSVALSSDGSRALIGARADDTEGEDAGAMYVFNNVCPSGTISANKGTACEPCPVGQVPNTDQTECISEEDSSSDIAAFSSGASPTTFSSNWMAWFII